MRVFKDIFKFFASLFILVLLVEVLTISSTQNVSSQNLREHNNYEVTINQNSAHNLAINYSSNIVNSKQNNKVRRNINSIDLLHKPKAVVNKKVIFKGKVIAGIKKVIIISSDNSINVYDSTVEDGKYKVECAFSTPGKKYLNLLGVDGNGDLVDELNYEIDIKAKKHLIENMPYFYQYNNRYYPASTCQNTTIAMLLNYYGWQGTPDYITKEYGKKYAQYAKGFSKVFNNYARDHNLNVRIRTKIDISPQYIENMLKEGKPVVVHGKFTSSGHIMVLVGFDNKYYYANDPAGKWNQQHNGDYKQRTPSNGKYVKYKKDNLLKALRVYRNIWIHEVYQNRYATK